jgi:hypothetical protein
MNTETFIVLAAAGLLWWKWRLKHGNATAYGSAEDRINAGLPTSGDTELNWWAKLHGQDVRVKDYSNGVGGVNPDPGSVGKAEIAASVNLAWNGDLKP